jgi:hypothetical protein
MRTHPPDLTWLHLISKSAHFGRLTNKHPCMGKLVGEKMTAKFSTTRTGVMQNDLMDPVEGSSALWHTPPPKLRAVLTSTPAPVSSTNFSTSSLGTTSKDLLALLYDPRSAHILASQGVLIFLGGFFRSQDVAATDKIYTLRATCLIVMHHIIGPNMCAQSHAHHSKRWPLAGCCHNLRKFEH